MLRKSHNVFTSCLGLLQVRHTKEFSNKVFNEHPHKYNLFGLSKMLSDYGIANTGTRITDKGQDLSRIECPFIAHTGTDFVVVYKLESDQVHYLWNGKKKKIEPSASEEKSNAVLLDYVAKADLQYTYENEMRVINLPEVEIRGTYIDKNKMSINLAITPIRAILFPKKE